VHDLAHTDRGHIAIALVGKHNPVREDSFNPGGHRRGAAMRSFDKIEVKEIIRKYRTAHRRNANRALTNAHFIQHFSHQAVGNAMRAARAVTGRYVRQRFRALVH